MLPIPVCLRIEVRPSEFRPGSGRRRLDHTKIIGWGSALILLPAFGLRTYRQWKNRHEPVNPSALWFFVLILIGTGGQVAYSWMVRNWVYLALNSALVVNNGVGLGIAIRRRKAAEPTVAHHSLNNVIFTEGRAHRAPRRPRMSKIRGSEVDRS